MNIEQLRALGLIETRACRYGTMSFLRTDQYIAQSLGYYGEFSESEIALWRTLVRPGDTVVSAGANIGAHIVWFARQHAGRVITVEPQKVLYEILLENIAQNGIGETVEAHHAALGKGAGKTALPAVDYRYPFSFGSIATGPASALGASAVVVDMVTIDALVNGRDVRMIHLDVEGHELDALAGAALTIRQSRPYLYLECDRPGQQDALLAWMNQNGYEALFHNAPLWNPHNFAGNPLNIFGNTVSISVLGVPHGGLQ